MNSLTTKFARPGLANRPLIVIVGETASGKSALALELAERYNGEIICADSRTVYKGMDIGTAKPSKEDQARVPHHLLDIVEPNQTFNVGICKGLTFARIEEIHAKGKLPILVGGTGLYIDSVIFDYVFNKGAEKDEQNPRHLKRAGDAQTEALLRPNTLVLGIKVPKEELEKRIINRVEKMFLDGLEAEVKELADQYGWAAEAMTGVGYREWQEYFAGQQTLEDTKELIIIHTRQYAKRQRTWFKRNLHIHWFQEAGLALAYAENWLMENNKTGKNITGRIEP